jgi:hypothetical protein
MEINKSVLKNKLSNLKTGKGLEYTLLKRSIKNNQQMEKNNTTNHQGCANEN